MDLWAQQQPLLHRFLAETTGTIVDLGTGQGRHARAMLEAGRAVLLLDRVLTSEAASMAIGEPARCRCVAGTLNDLPLSDRSVSALWACHCLEHVERPIDVLREWRRVLCPGGRLGIAVPPYKTEIVGRHVFTGWNPGQLMLTLFRAGYAVRDGAFIQHGYNVFALVRPAENPPTLNDNDEILYQYHEHFPPVIEQAILQRRTTNTFGEIISSFDGDFSTLGW